MLHVKTPRFNRLTSYLHDLTRVNTRAYNILKMYGEMGVEALAEATPKDTGLTASSWFYQIDKTSTGMKLRWYNTNILSDGTPLVILLEYGHGTINGSYVPGISFIKDTITPILKSLAIDLDREVKHA